MNARECVQITITEIWEEKHKIEKLIRIEWSRDKNTSRAEKKKRLLIF